MRDQDKTPCPQCYGSGWNHAPTEIPCDHCDGTGDRYGRGGHKPLPDPQFTALSREQETR